MRAGVLNQLVSLANAPTTTPDTDGFFAPLSPERVWASIEPTAPSGEGRSVFHLVTMRYHPQVTMDTRVLYGTRQLFVKGFQHVAEHGVELRLLCEEVIP